MSLQQWIPKCGLQTSSISIIWELTTNKNSVQKDTCSPIFTAVLSTITKIQKQPKCSSTDECVRKIWYTYTMEYSSAVKRMNHHLQLSEVSQRKTNHHLSLTCGI